jgi:outer membrane biosynthesis protein TonB
MMTEPYTPLDHAHIDEAGIPERYLRDILSPEERRSFETHLIDCQECADRLLLAEMFLLRSNHLAPAPAMETFTPGALSAEQPPPPAPAEPTHPAPAMAEISPTAPEPSAAQEPSAVPEPPPSEQRAEIPRFLRSPSEPKPQLPLRARIAAALTPWQLFLLFVLTAVLLLAIPTAGILLTEKYYLTH